MSTTASGSTCDHDTPARRRYVGVGGDQEEPVPSPSDIAGHRAVAGDIELDAGGVTVAGNVGDGDATVGVQHRPDFPYRGFDAVGAGLNSAQMGEGCDQANGAVAAHSQVADIIKEDDAGGTGRVLGRA